MADRHRRPSGPPEAGAQAAIAPEDLLTEMFGLVSARAGASRAAPPAAVTDATAGAVSRAVLLYSAVARLGLGPTALDVLEPLVPRVLADSAALRAAVRVEPFAGGLEDACGLVGEELHDLTAAFAVFPREAPNEHGDEFRRICAEAAALRLAEASAMPIWLLLRRQFAGRARPPARRRPAAPLADDREYYF